LLAIALSCMLSLYLKQTNAYELKKKKASLSTFKDTTYKPDSWHIGVRIHQIMEYVQDGKKVTMGYCGTSDMIADGLTKPLVLSKHMQFVQMCGLSEWVSTFDF